MSDLYTQYLQALRGHEAPALFLDLAALRSNMEWAVKNSGGKKLRIATKSVRSVEILKKILAHSPIFQGLMTFSLEEALWLRSLGFKDLLMGYPSTNQEALKRLAEDPSEITLMVDLPEHLEMLEALRPKKKFSVCLDLDLSMDLPGVRFGVYRSSLTGPEKLEALLQTLEQCHHIQLTGTMGYEAQVAGVMDQHSPLIRLLKKLSVRQLRERRQHMTSLILARGHELKFANGGGTGSLHLTREESCVTEVTVGSGFFAPGLFDHYQDFKLTPALAFTLPIVRRPEPATFTCLGGGYIASGAVEKAKLPTPYLPEGLTLLKHEGAGEVQTPMKYSGKREFKIGDVVIMRHAKAGEPCERFNEILLIEAGEFKGRVPTYRGEGKSFL